MELETANNTGSLKSATTELPSRNVPEPDKKATHLSRKPSSVGKKPRFKLIYVLIAAVVILVVVAAITIFSPNYERYIGYTESAPQSVGGATSMNYMPVLAEGVDWNTLSGGDREGIARYAVKVASNTAKTDGVTSFNVWGFSNGDRQTVFLYAGGDAITIYVDGNPTSISL